jgi:2,4-dienoyl-CoA reductase-like NADH-dependent reductase (Old Yellow Enzyme family)
MLSPFIGLVLEQNVPIGEGHQVPLVATVKRETGLVTMAVGMIQRPAHAEAILEAGEADHIALARAMLHDPHWPWHAAALDAEVDFPVQYIRGYKSRWHRGLRKGL